jgi:threonine dehydratase
MPHTAHPVTLSDVFAARRRIAPHVRRTPLLESTWLSSLGHSQVMLKLETLQVTNSFKARGALNATWQLVAERGREVTIVTASAGNHGRAIAWAAEQLGARAIVFTAKDAAQAKTNAIRRHGAELRAVAASYEEAERLAQTFARETDAVFISPYDHPQVIAGTGTIAIELLEDQPDLDAVAVPIGGGGLISGIAVALKALNPSVRVIGIEAEQSAAFTAARAEGRIVTIDVGPTIADGLGGNVDANTITWPFIRDLVDEVVVVPEDALRRGIRELAAHDHLIAEGAGIAAAAAVASGLLHGATRTAVVLSGSNIDIERLSDLLR